MAYGCNSGKLDGTVYTSWSCRCAIALDLGFSFSTWDLGFLNPKP